MKFSVLASMFACALAGGSLVTQSALRPARSMRENPALRFRGGDHYWHERSSYKKPWWQFWRKTSSDKAREAANEAKAAGKDAAEAARKAAYETKDATKSAAGYARDSTKRAAYDAKESTKRAASDAKEAAKKAASDAKRGLWR